VLASQNAATLASQAMSAASLSVSARTSANLSEGQPAILSLRRMIWPAIAIAVILFGLVAYLLSSHLRAGHGPAGTRVEPRPGAERGR
jgi:hypothetical protein